MSTIGRFLELGVRSTDILESLHFYKLLGFAELETSDVFTHKYAVVSDGELNIGLHDTEFESPAVTFVQPDLAKHARAMADHGFDFTHLRLDEDVFNELSFQDRDGNTVMMVEARTFHLNEEAENDSACGSWFELTLPVRNTVRAAKFWAPIAPALLEMREEPTTHMRFDATGVALGLSESIALKAPSLCFKCPDRERLLAILEQHDFAHEAFPGFEGAFVGIRAPEGTMLYAFEEDFLGESYEVEESDDPSEYSDR